MGSPRDREVAPTELGRRWHLLVFLALYFDSRSVPQEKRFQGLGHDGLVARLKDPVTLLMFAIPLAGAVVFYRWILALGVDLFVLATVTIGVAWSTVGAYRVVRVKEKRG